MVTNTADHTRLWCNVELPVQEKCSSEWRWRSSYRFMSWQSVWINMVSERLCVFQSGMVEVDGSEKRLVIGANRSSCSFKTTVIAVTNKTQHSCHGNQQLLSVSDTHSRILWALWFDVSSWNAPWEWLHSHMAIELLQLSVTNTVYGKKWMGPLLTTLLLNHGVQNISSHLAIYVGKACC